MTQMWVKYSCYVEDLTREKCISFKLGGKPGSLPWLVPTSDPCSLPSPGAGCG